MNSEKVNSKKTVSKKTVSKKSVLPTYQEYNEALSYVKKSKESKTSFNSPEEITKSMKYLQIIKVCQQAEIKKMKEDAKNRLEIEPVSKKYTDPIICSDIN